MKPLLIIDLLKDSWILNCNNLHSSSLRTEKKCQFMHLSQMLYLFFHFFQELNSQKNENHDTQIPLGTSTNPPPNRWGRYQMEYEKWHSQYWKQTSKPNSERGKTSISPNLWCKIRTQPNTRKSLSPNPLLPRLFIYAFKPITATSRADMCHFDYPLC